MAHLRMSPIAVRRDENLALITLDDGKANAMNGPFLDALEAALEETSDADAVVIAGRPGFYSGGLDIKSLPKLPRSELRAVLEHFARLMLRIYTHPRPVLAAVTGHAIAGGTVLILATDSATSALGPFRLGLNETALGIGLPLFIVEMARLRVSTPALHAVVAEGRLFDPEGAHAIGLVDGLAAPDAVLREVTERARALARLPKAYGDNKRTLRGPIAQTGASAFEKEIESFTSFVVGAAK